MAEPSTSTTSPAPLNPSRGELPIVQATTDLIKWFVPLLNRLPREQKFALGDRIISNLYAVLETLVAARWSRDKIPLLEPAAARLDLLRIQTRLLHDFQLIDTRRYEHASRLLEAVARQLSGWLQQQRRQPA
ncbi:MAG: diversity-generating retroelement protein Avd [Cyanobacteriota bacterium]|nr:diversity-generating retroelement protein Avd [Cyanobacteriota bacterium]